MDIQETAVINVELLARQLAIAAWEYETKEKSADNLYETVMQGSECVKQIKPEWASVYWSQVTAYKELIMAYAIK